MKYGVLNQKNGAYRPELWRKIRDLYRGGFDILKRAKDYIPQQVGENDERYKERLELASYINYMGMVVDGYVANLFAQEPVVGPAPEKADHAPPMVDDYWADFAKDANLKSESFAKLMREVFTEGLLNQRAIVGCDFPVLDITPETRSEEDAVGTSRGYAFEICLEELLDWEHGEVVMREVALSNGAKVTFAYGLMSWAILKRRVRRRDTPEDDRSTFFDEFRVWRMVDGFATCRVFRTKPRKDNEPEPRDDEELEPVSELRTTFRQIPLVELVIPEGLWLGNKLGPIALELFRRRSALNASENRALFPVPVVKLGPETPGVGQALPSERQQNPTRGDDALDPIKRAGGLVLGHQDSYELVEPEGKAFEIVDKQLSELVDEFFRVSSMMAASVSSTKKALGRSGTSKQEDHRSMTVVLEAYGAIVRDFAARVYGLISEARQEDIEWKVHGLDKFDVIDRQIVLDEAKSLSLVSIPSPTFHAQWKLRTALLLLGNVSQEVQHTIQKEIERGIAAEELQRSVLNGIDDVEEGFDDAGADPGRDPRVAARTARAPNGAPPPRPRARDAPATS